MVQCSWNRLACGEQCQHVVLQPRLRRVLGHARLHHVGGDSEFATQHGSRVFERCPSIIDFKMLGQVQRPHVRRHPGRFDDGRVVQQPVYKDLIVERDEVGLLELPYSLRVGRHLREAILHGAEMRQRVNQPG